MRAVYISSERSSVICLCVNCIVPLPSSLFSINNPLRTRKQIQALQRGICCQTWLTWLEDLYSSRSRQKCALAISIVNGIKTCRIAQSGFCKKHIRTMFVFGYGCYSQMILCFRWMCIKAVGMSFIFKSQQAVMFNMRSSKPPRLPVI